MMNEKFLALIVPVYNAEKYLEEFLESLKSQNQNNFRAYFIDDCSTDNSYKIIQNSIQNETDWYLYKNEKRMGAAYSRNFGIEQSKEEYIHCLDADDIISDELVQEVYNSILTYSPDMIMIERDSFIEDSSNIIPREYDEIWPKGYFSNQDFKYCMMARSLNGTYDRIISRKFLEKYNIRFQDLSSSNDVFYIVFSTLLAEKIVHTDTYKCLYHQRIHYSPSRISTNRSLPNAYSALLQVKNQLEYYDKLEDVGNCFWQYVLISLQDQMKTIKESNKQKEFFRYLTTEGFKKLGVGSECFNHVVSPAYKEVYSELMHRDFEDEYVKSSFYMRGLCNEMKNKIKLRMNDFKLSEIKLAIWGMGNYSVSFIELCTKYGIEFDYYIDKNPNLKEYHGKKIVRFEEVNDVDVIIVTSNYYYNDIKREILKKFKDVDVVNLIQWLFE